MARNIKEDILESAEQLFATKGFEKATISDIAKEAGVHEASVYSNFKNKRKILFDIYVSYFMKATRALKEHFKGMREPGPKLRKAIWHYLDDLKNHPNHARLLMTGLRETREFYGSDYYKYVKEYSNIVSNIIMTGQAEGLFRKDCNFRLIRNMALGTCVFTGYYSIAHHIPYDPDEYSDLIYQLVLRANRGGLSPSQGDGIKSDKNRIELRRAKIIEKATEVFSNKGFLGATISDIAKNAQLADGTLYEYFDTKEKILLGVAETHLQDISYDAFIFHDLHRVEKALRELIWRWIGILWSRKDFASVLTLELFRNLKFYSSPGYQYIRSYLGQIKAVVEQGQKEGVFVENVPFPVYFNMVLGTIDQYLISHFLVHRPPTEIAELSDMVDSLVRAIKIEDA